MRWALEEDSRRGEAGPVWLSREEVRVATQADGDWLQYGRAEVGGCMKYSEGRLVWLWRLTGWWGGAEVSKEAEPRIAWTLGGRRRSHDNGNRISRVPSHLPPKLQPERSSLNEDPATFSGFPLEADFGTRV